VGHEGVHSRIVLYTALQSDSSPQVESRIVLYTALQSDSSPQVESYERVRNTRGEGTQRKYVRSSPGCIERGRSSASTPIDATSIRTWGRGGCTRRRHASVHPRRIRALSDRVRVMGVHRVRVMEVHRGRVTNSIQLKRTLPQDATD
jgi:hypothetical protein